MSSQRSPNSLLQFLDASRFHIVLVAGLATITFGWLFSGQFVWLLAALVAVDWWVLDLGNKVGDLAEDLRNAPEHARWVEKHRQLLLYGSIAVFVLSLALSRWHTLWLIPLRLLFQLLGVIYNFKTIPCGRGRFTRFKDLYIGKNLSAGILFVISVLGYPLVGLGDAISVSWGYLACCALFFIFFEMSFEVIYDLKDIEGDRAEGIPTFPAVHGDAVGMRVSAAFALTAIVVISAALVTGLFGFREVLIILAPGLQLVMLPLYRKRGYRARDTVWITHLASAQLLIYNAYAYSGLPIPPWS